jgi:hypothetical protein
VRFATAACRGRTENLEDLAAMLWRSCGSRSGPPPAGEGRRPIDGRPYNRPTWAVHEPLADTGRSCEGD